MTVIMDLIGGRLLAMILAGIGGVLMLSGIVWRHDVAVSKRTVEKIEQKAREDVDRGSNAARMSRDDASAGRVRASPYRRD